MKTNFKQNLIAGIFAILPVALTLWLIYKLFSLFAGPGSQILDIFFNEKMPYVSDFIGFIFTIAFIYFLGLFIRNILGKKIFSWIESIMSKIPLVNTIYKTIKQITTTISGTNKRAFKKVVLIQYPRNGLWTITMVTGESKDIKGIEYYHIFVPTTPNPTSGFMLIVPKKDAQETNMSVEEGLKVIISGGLLAPDVNDIEGTNS
ncbi:MAG: DUF502 domain-containing protein [Candidatus Marinimicrobia bacterium]|nr:DUF502 domain-containing protein [Candidatus Neomarinimicrobiota bacterium]MBL7023035.1 DUF502 domain-containing protein [Candidatus Neomarinimicrobiota bacterium]MBL7110248.1 DUF502 domain-containing protein [Candidatus Neomarinimicrobiota bacterium]